MREVAYDTQDLPYATRATFRPCIKLLSTNYAKLFDPPHTSTLRT